MGARKAVGLAMALVALCLLPASASADHHLMKIRQIGSGPIPYVELQMYAPGQTVLGGHTLTYYGPTGNLTRTFTFPATPPGGPLNGESQRTILISSGAPEGVVADYPDAGLSIAAAAGAVCFNTVPSSLTDCVSWGGFSGNSTLPSSAGTPLASFPDPGAITRTIAPGCSTLLEASDDSENTAVDFSATPRAPRNNASAPTETACTGGGGGTLNRPQTTITDGPKKKSTKRRVKIAFESDEPRSTFKCKLDKGEFKACESPFKARVKRGKHHFAVFAIDADGNEDQSPAEIGFRVKRATKR
jgi:hypothetical protein